MSPAEMYMLGAAAALIGLKGLQVAYNHRSRRRAWERDARLSAGLRDRKR